MSRLEAQLHFPSAYVLVSHGSRDPRYQIAMEHLAKLVRQQLQSIRNQTMMVGSRITAPLNQDSSNLVPIVETAVLEFGASPLHQQLQQLGERAIQAGYETISILPVFLLTGVHVMEDLPSELALAQQDSRVKFILLPHLGSHPDLWRLLLNPIDPAAPQVGKVLLSHGSRRTGSQQAVEAVAAQLNAVVAYWSVPPSLADQISALIQQGHQQIAILPYFLFEGGLTDAISKQVESLRQQFPYAQLHLSRPIGATAELAERVVELLVDDRQRVR
jgi:sirohydrochlorin ferrochelatase